MNILSLWKAKNIDKVKIPFNHLYPIYFWNYKNYFFELFLCVSSLQWKYYPFDTLQNMVCKDLWRIKLSFQDNFRFVLGNLILSVTSSFLVTCLCCNSVEKMSERQRERADSSQLDIVFGLLSRVMCGHGVFAKKGIQKRSLADRNLDYSISFLRLSAQGCLTVLKARNPKSRGWQGCSLWNL